MTRDREGFAVASDGAPIYWRTFGQRRAGAPDVILSDGIGCDGYVWKYLERALGEEHRVLHWHYRGHGRTPVPRNRRNVGIADLADDLATVLDAAGSERAVLAGHSMGVQVCLEAYRRHRDRTAALVLLCGAYGNPLRTFKGRRTLETALPYIAFGVQRVPALVRLVWRSIIPTRLAYEVAARTEINAELVNVADFMPYLDHIARVEPTLFVEMLSHLGRHTARELLPHVAVPTLVVAGGRDGFTPRSISEEMARLIPESELLVVEDGSHTTPIERPQLVCDRVVRFLRERVRAQPPVRAFV